MHRRKVRIKKKERVYEFFGLRKTWCYEFLGVKVYFSSQKVDGNMISIDYWKVLVLNFSEMDNTVFFWAKTLMERWYLLITENFLFWTFRRWNLRSFLRRKVDGKMIFIDYWKVLVFNFSMMGNTVFFSAKKLMEW